MNSEIWNRPPILPTEENQTILVEWLDERTNSLKVETGYYRRAKEENAPIVYHLPLSGRSIGLNRIQRWIPFPKPQ